MNKRRLVLWLMCVIVTVILVSALFTSTAQKTRKGLDSLPPELDVRVKGGVLSGRLPESSKAQSQVAAADTLARPNAAQSKSLRSLEVAAAAPISVEYNRLTGTPRHMFAASGYLTQTSSEVPEKIARDFIQRWQGIFRFSDSDLQGLKLKSRATLPDLGATILLFEQQIDDVPIYKGEVMVNVNRDGHIINVGGDSYPQLAVTNAVTLTPEQAITAAAASMGFDGYAPHQSGTKRIPRSFGSADSDFVDAPRFDKGGPFSDDIVVTHVLFPLGGEARHAYNFVLTTPQYGGIMWNNIVDAQTGQVLRRTSLTSFFGGTGGGPANSRRATFRPDVQDLIESHNAAGTASGNVFDGMPVALSGRRTCAGNIPPSACNGNPGVGGTIGSGYGRSPAPGTPPTYQPDNNEFNRNNGRGFKKALVNARSENPFADTGGALFPALFNSPFGQILHGFPDASNPSPYSRFGWFYLPTASGGAEIAVSDNNRAATRAYKYDMTDEAKSRNLAANSPVADKSQPFSADLTPLGASLTLRDGRVLSSVFQSRYTEGNNVLVADDRADDDETTSGIKGYSANRQFTAGYFNFTNGYEYGGVDAREFIPSPVDGSDTGAPCQTGTPCHVDYPASSNADVYPGTVALFFYTNLMHDYLYSIGFTEETWNFQQDNFGLGGAGQDALSANVQDGSGTDNANMGTPNDGSAPRMQMYLFTEGGFRRSDGDLDFDVVGHEFYHGVSNRSAGKGAADCLGTPLVGESGGQGEGWSDFIASSMSDDDSEGEFVTGEFDIGIRRLPYTNYRWSYASINGGSLNRRDQGVADPGPVPAIPFEVHNVGEVFTAVLWDMRELFIMKDPSGVFFDGSRRLNGGLATSSQFFIGSRQVRSIDFNHPINYRTSFNTTTAGTTVGGVPNPGPGIVPIEQATSQVPTINAAEHIVRPGLLTTEIQSRGDRVGPLATAVSRGARLADTLVLRGLQISPCNPSFVDTRNSILLADKEMNGGENRSLIWRAFASHGIGVNAQSANGAGSSNPVVEDFTVPATVTTCETLGPLATPAFALANSAANKVTVTINAGVPVPGAAEYLITRSFKAAGPFTRIAEIPATQTSYEDNNLSAGQTYFYQVRASRDASADCVSSSSVQSVAVSNGIVITPPPTFFGVDQVIDPQTGNSLMLKWNSAITPNPGGDVFAVCPDCVYDVYRVEKADTSNSTSDPTFTPSAANRVATGVNALQFTDTSLQLGQIYYYIVHARNAAGKKDTNDVGNRQVRYNMPTITSFKPVAPFANEDYESSSADARFQPPLQESGNDPQENTPTWQRVTAVQQPGGATTSMMYAPDFDPGSDGANSDIGAVIGPLTLSATSVLDFDHFFSSEARFDGGVLEIAKGGPNFNATPFPDNTTTFDLGDYIVEGQYNSKLDGDVAGTGVPGSALVGRRAFTGIKGLHHVRVALGEFAPGGDNNMEGASIFLRFRMSSDVGTTSGENSGWYVDNLIVHDMGTGGTPTPTPTPSPSPSPSPSASPSPGASPTPPITSILQFSSATFAGQEDEAQVTARIIRTGSTSGAVTVDITSSDGTAKQKGDYTSVFGHIVFESGETQKDVPVLINEDSYSEGQESFTILLSNPSAGSTLGATSTASVQIVDDASESSSNSIDDSRIFAGQHYHDFLYRQSDQSGEDFWTNVIESCGANAQCRQAKRVDVSTAFFLSIEFQQTGYMVIRAHKAGFGNDKTLPRYPVFLRDLREISEGIIVGQGNWEQQLETNKQNFLADFVTRSDFVTQFPQGSPAATYVNKLFTNTGATPSTAETDAATSAYGSGNTAGRAAALRSVIESGSVFNKLYNDAFVLMQYYGYLRRNPDDSPDGNFVGYDFWLTKMNQFSLPGEDMRDPNQAQARAQRAEMVRAFIESAEYRQRFFGSPTGNQIAAPDVQAMAPPSVLRGLLGATLRYVFFGTAPV